MGPTQFDLLTRALTQRTTEMPSRRSLLRGLGGGLLGASLARLPDAEARRRKGNGKRNKKKCKGGKQRCSGRCVDLQTDGRNCGSCGNICDAAELCQDGACIDNGPCPVNQARCEGQCVDIYTEPTDCGGCGTNCAANQICLLGDCCQPHNSICLSADQCCSDYCLDVDEFKPTGEVCHSASVAPHRCCVRLGSVCLDPCDCCSALICENQRCCAASGQPCDTDSHCCSGSCGPDGQCV
jgi:hypothetical protein